MNGTNIISGSGKNILGYNESFKNNVITLPLLSRIDNLISVNAVIRLLWENRTDTKYVTR